MYKNLAMNVRTVNDAKITALVRNFLTVADNLLGFFNSSITVTKLKSKSI